jgi:phosphoribosylglycinamide formyltransferase 2
MSPAALASAQDMAAKVVAALEGEGRGWGLYGVEFFVRSGDRGEEVIFSELSPRPHDTGMVTLASQDLSEFDLHARAVLGLPVPSEIEACPAASSVILADRESEAFGFGGLAEAMALDAAKVDVRIFGKPVTRPYRRMGVALARGMDVETARSLANKAANAVRIAYRDGPA